MLSFREIGYEELSKARQAEANDSVMETVYDVEFFGLTGSGVGIWGFTDRDGKI